MQQQCNATLPAHMARPTLAFNHRLATPTATGPRQALWAAMCAMAARQHRSHVLHRVLAKAVQQPLWCVARSWYAGLLVLLGWQQAPQESAEPYVFNVNSRRPIKLHTWRTFVASR